MKQPTRRLYTGPKEYILDRQRDRPRPCPSSLRHSMPRFFFAFKWADYARVPLLRVVCTVQRAGMGRIRIGKVAKGEREGRDGRGSKISTLCALRTMQPIWHAGCVLHAARVISLWTGIMWLVGNVGIRKDALFPV